MMRLLVLLLAMALVLSSCTALPAEERAFAVALMVDGQGVAWTVHARIPTYRTGGGYQTVSGEGNSLAAALNRMEAAAPMQVDLSQLRVLMLDAALGQRMGEAMRILSDRPDMRQDCYVLSTREDAAKLADALAPTTGARLSKGLELLLESRIQQGLLPVSTLAEILCMGERQTPVLPLMILAGDGIDLSGGLPITVAGTPGGALSPEEMMLLSLLTMKLSSVGLTLQGVSARVRDVSSRISLSDDLQAAEVKLTLRMTEASCTPKALEEALSQALLTLLNRLYAQGCDVLGLARRAMLRCGTWEDWRALDWPDICRNLRWRVSVGVNPPA